MPHESTVNPHEFSNEEQYGHLKKISRVHSSNNIDELAPTSTTTMTASTVPLLLDAASANNPTDKVLAFSIPKSPAPPSSCLSSRPQTPNVLNHDFDDDSDDENDDSII